MSKVIIDPKLQDALAQAGRSEPLNVFVKVCRKAPAVDPPSRLKQMAAIVKRVSGRSGAAPKYQYRELDDVLQVVALPSFVSKLVAQPEVLSASIAPGYRSALIPPMDTQDVDEKAIDRPVKIRRSAPRGRRSSTTSRQGRAS